MERPVAEGLSLATVDPYLHSLPPPVIEPGVASPIEAPTVGESNIIPELHELDIVVDAILHYITRFKTGTPEYEDAHAEVGRNAREAGITTLEFRMLFFEAQSRLREKQISTLDM